ncbi:hypothetical protein [Cellulomonas sp. PhB150]|uniref:hypothetical protein n=1 Tax=Cellulomonas sp. PhB150 TaxID=2485188 RepID=UPI000F47AC19|nr:hypothetical protein [Cellulomonas sp. PhB150]ROS31764.1 hypothetical protein EDF34_1432 [Cellulomonas sp. PhB150]
MKGGRSASVWLRAYPRRWRAVRASEMLTVLEEQAGPTRRLDARTVVDLVLGGWATRVRMRPPLRVVAAYRLFDRRPAARYDAWLRDDVDGLLFPLRDALWTPVALLPLVLLIAQVWSDAWVNFVLTAPVLVVGQAIVTAFGRSRRIAHLFPPPPGPDVGPFLPYRGLDGVVASTDRAVVLDPDARR